ncbi:hypothetical protein [Aquimarina sp. 2201CG14-23]|uniref:hypothetical protein n=1 Tax=Aquimarina mycalae TaxID=3040073 RepID=UPI0024781481|nr:hypothetical protein [Aquimarina sp. 2201CG14-23]MDH7447400.1 hypothetical protein [Aquimarina sp. 2201CG14-23]
MKKSLKNLELKKQTISRLEQNSVKGGGFLSFVFCPSRRPQDSCYPPGGQCL